MYIVMVASECAPVAKVGGLGDVVFGLSRELEIRGHDLEVSDLLANQVMQTVERVDGVTDVRVSRETGSPEELIIVDRQKAADMNLTVSRVANVEIVV